MSDVMEKITNQKLQDREQLTTVELTDKELENVHGAWFGGFPSFNNSTAFAVTSIAFSQNNNSFCPFW